MHSLVLLSLLASFANDPACAKVPGPFVEPTEFFEPCESSPCLEDRGQLGWARETVANEYVTHGLAAYGYKAYVSTVNDLMVVDAATDKFLWKSSRLGFSRLSILKAQPSADYSSSATAPADNVIVWGSGSGHPGLFFEAATGKEVLLRSEGGETPVIHDLPKPVLRGEIIEPMEGFCGDDSQILEPHIQLVSNVADFSALWQRHAGTLDRLPVVDFERQMVLAVFDGLRSNCNGIDIEYALDTGDYIEVFLRHWNYQSHVSQADMDGKPWLDPNNNERPYGIHVLPKIAKPVQVKVDRRALIRSPSVWQVRAVLPAAE